MRAGANCKIAGVYSGRTRYGAGTGGGRPARRTRSKLRGRCAASTVRIANANEVRARTGFAIGGVAPIAHTSDEITAKLLDDSLLRFETVWAAAGTPHSMFPIGLAKLKGLTRAQVAEIASEVEG